MHVYVELDSIAEWIGTRFRSRGFVLVGSTPTAIMLCLEVLMMLIFSMTSIVTLL